MKPHRPDAPQNTAAFRTTNPKLSAQLRSFEAGVQAVARRHLQSNRVEMSLPGSKEVSRALKAIEKHRVRGDDTALRILAIRPKWLETKRKVQFEFDSQGKAQIKVHTPPSDDEWSVESDATLKTSNLKSDVPFEIIVHQDAVEVQKQEAPGSSSSFASRFYSAVRRAFAPYAVRLAQTMIDFLPVARLDGASTQSSAIVALSDQSENQPVGLAQWFAQAVQSMLIFRKGVSKS